MLADRRNENVDELPSLKDDLSSASGDVDHSSCSRCANAKVAVMLNVETRKLTRSWTELALSTVRRVRRIVQMKHHAMAMSMIVVASSIPAEFHALPIVDDMWNSKVLTNASARLAARGLFVFRSHSLGVSWKPSWTVILRIHMVSQPSEALAGMQG